MENEILGLVLIGCMLFAIFVGFPISFTLIGLGFVFGYIGFGQVVFYLMTFQFSSVMLEQTLAADARGNRVVGGDVELQMVANTVGHTDHSLDPSRPGQSGVRAQIGTPSIPLPLRVL